MENRPLAEFSDEELLALLAPYCDMSDILTEEEAVEAFRRIGHLRKKEGLAEEVAIELDPED
jgi:tellurite resistance protein